MDQQPNDCARDSVEWRMPGAERQFEREEIMADPRLTTYDLRPCDIQSLTPVTPDTAHAHTVVECGCCRAAVGRPATDGSRLLCHLKPRVAAHLDHRHGQFHDRAARTDAVRFARAPADGIARSAARQ